VLTVTSRIVSDVVIFDLSGRFSFMEYGLRDQTKELMDAGHLALILNLAEVSYIDSFGVGQIFSIWTSIRAKHGQIVLLHPAAPVLTVLQATKLDTIFQVFTDEAQAIAQAKQA
jgi:anti-sigma B factor antagonist